MTFRSLLARVKEYVPLPLKVSARKIQARAVAIQMRLAALTGNYRCSVCGRRVKEFLPLPEYLTENIKKHGFPYKEPETCNVDQYSCPFCEASDRDRLYALYLSHGLPRSRSNGSLRILDFAPSAPLRVFIKGLIGNSVPEASYRTADLYAENVDDKVDITDLGAYGDETIDFFICSHVLEHVPDDRRAMRELYRILRNGGRGILMVPIVLDIAETDEDPTVTDVSERWRRFGQDDHVRQYSRADFIKRVEQAGFRVYQYGNAYFGERAFKEHGIAPGSILYVVEK